METLLISKDAQLSTDGGTLFVRTENGKRRLPIKGLGQIIIAGEAGLTTSLLCLLGRNSIRVTMLDWYGNVTGSFEPSKNPRSGRIRQLQALASNDETHRIDLAHRFVEGAAKNMLANLRYRKYRGVSMLDNVISEINSQVSEISTSVTIESLMGHEGLIRAWYFDAWRKIDNRLDFGVRVRRPPNNEINCLLSWYNGLIYALCRNEIAKTHLDDCISFLHSAREARSSLALDLAEVFKPAICDSLIIELVLRGTNWCSWFHINDKVCRLSETGKRKTMEIWAEKLDSPIGGANSLRELVLKEALAVERHILGVNKYQPWKRKV
ncbi:MAG: CRISPR-associated endonuclease Cas1 [Gammaproteobacteria bacterium]|nr:CRISPR-associated endonuclease Cas1 [Gammaproteobacteria bacterium]